MPNSFSWETISSNHLISKRPKGPSPPLSRFQSSPKPQRPKTRQPDQEPATSSRHSNCLQTATMVLSRVVNIVLRAAELAFAAIVAGITGWILARSNEDTPGFGRFIYTEVIAAITILVALLWLIPFSSSFIHWPFDFFVSVCWFAAFGILVHVSASCSHPSLLKSASPRSDVSSGVSGLTCGVVDR